eukprot:5781046-Amphidinium_carterae.1
MQANASWGHRSMRRKAGLTPFFVPVRAVEDDMLQIFDFFTTSDTYVPHLESRVRTLFMPNSAKSS